MALDQGIIDSVTNTNFKSIAEMQTVNALGHQNRMNAIFESSIGQIVNKMNTLDPTESAAISGVVSSDLAKEVAQLGAAVTSIMQYMKGGQTTLPETGQG